MGVSKILFLVPDGVGVRNYLYSNTIKLLNQQNNNIVIGTVLPEIFIKQLKELHSCEIGSTPIKIYIENISTRLFRESATFARLKHNAEIVNNPTILKNWNFNPNSFKQKILVKTSQIIGNWAAKKYHRIINLERKATQNWDKNSIEEATQLLNQIKPQKIFITHQRVAGLMPYCIAAKKLGIEVVTVIYSWDNLPKARLAVKADKYLVWSDYMKEEMKQFYPEISSDDVLVTGTPQFEFYLEKERLLNREAFAQMHNLNPNKKWICFSGDDVKTSPYDPTYLNDVAEAIQSIEEHIRPQIIFRRCPVDFSERYNTVLEKFKSIIVPINPLWNTAQTGQNWGYVFPQSADIDLQVNIAYHCEAVINLGSTMAHDFAIYNKPCFYLNYDTINDDNWSVKTIYNYQHFRSMKDLDAVLWFNNAEEIKNKIEGFLNKNMAFDINDREIWLSRVIKQPIDCASESISNLLVG